MIQPWWQSECGRFTLYCADCLDVLPQLEAGSVQAVVTDPPYGLSFMGKKWDYDVPGESAWRGCLGVLPPGGHLLAFAGTRTQHRMAVRIEDAGFEIRDMVAWVYGSGFPKSLDVSKAIDKAAGAEREVVGSRPLTGTARIIGGQGGATAGRADAMYQTHVTRDTLALTVPATDEAKQWQGWGTALKPAMEPITVARKPLEGTVAENVLRYGTGAINVDGCRVGTEGGTRRDGKATMPNESGWENMRGHGVAELNAGRWPANFIHDGSDEVVGGFPGEDSGSAARFFYCAKASKRDRDEGCEGLDATVELIGAAGHKTNPMTGRPVVDLPRRNHHPTVKPTDLMRYLCRLITPPGGTVLDPFAGSGSTGKACVAEGFGFIGIEISEDYCRIAKRRIQQAIEDYALFDRAPEPEPQPMLIGDNA